LDPVLKKKALDRINRIFRIFYSRISGRNPGNLMIEHEVQLVNYLKGVKRDIGLLINFGPSGVEVKRKYQAFDMEE
jgi:hypothetical protein